MARGWVAPIAWTFLLSASLEASEWNPIVPAELAEKTSVVEPAADAEIIFSDTRILDEVISGHPQWSESNYIRIKVFTNRGRSLFSIRNITIPPNTSISGIAARTIHPDGSILEVKKDAIRETKTKSGNVVTRQMTFAMPGLEEGSIIEYRWRETHSEAYAQYIRLSLQRDIPARVIRYYIKPYSSPNFNYTMAMQRFNVPPGESVRQADWFYLKSVENVPAFKANLESLMPPANMLQMWSLIYYHPGVSPEEPDHYWRDLGKSLYSQFKLNIKTGREIRQKAAEITAAARNEDTKLTALYAFCQRNIKNQQTDAVSAEERHDAVKNQSPEDTLTQGVGTAEDIRYLFASLASALGFDARIALLPSREEVFFSRNFPNRYFLRAHVVAVKTESGWRFFDPAQTSLPIGLLFWRYEGVPAFITDPKEPVFVNTPYSTPENNKIKNEGTFQLLDNGTLDGKIVVTLSGHEGLTLKEQILRQSEDQRIKEFERRIKSRLSTAEISDITIENADSFEKPLIYRANMRVPGYAERTGKRLFFAPAVFQHGAGPRFPNRDRKYPVYFHYAWAEEDTVSISIPDGFEFEAPRIPEPVSFGDVGGLAVKARIQGGNKLIFSRSLSYGNKALIVPRERYQNLKTGFDAITAADGQTFSLKQKDS